MKGVVRNVFLGRMEAKPSIRVEKRAPRIDSSDSDHVHQEGSSHIANPVSFHYCHYWTSLSWIFSISSIHPPNPPSPINLFFTLLCPARRLSLNTASLAPCRWLMRGTGGRLKGRRRERWVFLP